MLPAAAVHGARVTLEFKLHPYAPAAHGAFVRGTWTADLAWEWLRTRVGKQTRDLLWRALARVLRDPGGRCVVSADPEDADTLYGWACSWDGHLVHSYVRTAGGLLDERARLELRAAMIRELGAADGAPMLPLLRQGGNE